MLAVILSTGQSELLRDRVLQLLEDVGLKVESDELQTLLLRRGWTTRPSGRISVPRGLIAEMVDMQRPSQPQDVLDQELHLRCGVDFAHHVVWNKRQDELRRRHRDGVLISAFDCGPSTYYDYDRGELRPVDTEVFVRMMKFAQTTPEIGYISTWYRQDVPQEVERIASLVLALRYTDKVDGIEAIDPAVIKYLAAISEILTGRSGDCSCLAGSECMTSPLVLERRSAEDILERRRYAVHRYHVASMPTLGAAVPCSVAGGLLMTAAEILGGMAVCFAVDPESDLSGRAIAIGMDMRTASSTPSAPEATSVNLAVKELFDAWWGGHLWVEVFFSPFAKRPGLQAVYENFAGQWRYSKLVDNSDIPYPGMGTLNSGGTGSPVQFMLDLEIIKSQFALPGSAVLDEDQLPFAEICETVAARGDFLASEHTARHCRELWHSRLFRTDSPFHGLWRGDEKSILDDCQWRWQENLRHFQAPSRAEDTTRALEGVLARAKREFGISWSERPL